MVALKEIRLLGSRVNIKSKSQESRCKGCDITLVEWINRAAIKIILFDSGKAFLKWRKFKQDSSIPVEIFFSDSGALEQTGLKENSNSIV